jgi:hypothetical protein
MEAIYFPGTSYSLRTTRRYNPEEYSLHRHSREKLKSNTTRILFSLIYFLAITRFLLDSSRLEKEMDSNAKQEG